jgi:putative transposase
MIKVKGDLIMKKMTEHQIVAILKEAEAGVNTPNLVHTTHVEN